jgi:hypothetical protein
MGSMCKSQTKQAVSKCGTVLVKAKGSTGQPTVKKGEKYYVNKEKAGRFVRTG